MLSLSEIIITILVILAIYLLGNNAPKIARTLGNGLEYCKNVIFKIPREIEEKVDEVKDEIKEVNNKK